MPQTPDVLQPSPICSYYYLVSLHLTQNHCVKMIFFFLQVVMSDGDNFEIRKRKGPSAVGSSKACIL